MSYLPDQRWARLLSLARRRVRYETGTYEPHPIKVTTADGPLGSRDEVPLDVADAESVPALGIEDHGGRFTAR